MKKNVASQSVSAQMTTAADGTDFTGTVTVYITGDNGTQTIGSVGSGICTHEGKGLHSYAPSQAETNYDHIDFTFQGSGAITVTRHEYTDFPQTGDSYAIVNSGTYGNSAIHTETAAIKVKTDFLPSATAGSAGGVFIAGSNADTTFATLTVSGATTLTGNVSLGGTLGIAGLTTLHSLTVTNNATISGNWLTTGTTTLTGAVTASNASNNIVGIDVAKISGDATAADNAESFFDGTGYAGTNNVIPVVTLVNGLAANTITATAIATDAITAAKIATGAIDADALAADAVTEIVAANWAATMDGVAYSKWIQLTGQFLFGVTTISGSNRITKARNGTTTILTVTKGGTAGALSASSIV